MTEDEKDKVPGQVAEQPKAENLADWSTDFFPTSAKKIYYSLGLMFFGIIILILLSVYLSVDEETKKEDSPKKKTENIFSQDEDQ